MINDKNINFENKTIHCKNKFSIVSYVNQFFKTTTNQDQHKDQQIKSNKITLPRHLFH